MLPLNFSISMRLYIHAEALYVQHKYMTMINTMQSLPLRKLQQAGFDSIGSIYILKNWNEFYWINVHSDEENVTLNQQATC